MQTSGRRGFQAAGKCKCLILGAFLEQHRGQCASDRTKGDSGRDGVSEVGGRWTEKECSLSGNGGGQGKVESRLQHGVIDSFQGWL